MTKEEECGRYHFVTFLNANIRKPVTSDKRLKYT